MGAAALFTNERTQQLLAELATPEGQADPYPRYRELRRIAPMTVANDGSIVVTRYAECAAMGRDHRFGKDWDRVFTQLGFADWAEHVALHTFFNSVLGLNPPDHTRLRALVASAFTPRRVAQLHDWIERLVDQFLTAMPAEADFVTSFALPLPMAVIGQMLGIPAGDRAHFRPLVATWLQVTEIPTPAVVSEADAAVTQIRDYLATLIAARRAQPADDLMSELISARVNDDRFSEDELVTMAATLVGAGFETTTHLLGNALVALLQHPDQFARLRDEPTLAKGAVEEFLRFDGPVQITNRTAISELSLGGLTLAPGQRVVAYLGAGNRDPDRFVEPDRFDVGRAGNAPLSFGGGIHHCLGATLARTETQIAIEAIATARPHLHLAGDPERRPGLALRGFAHIPVGRTA